jgi:hypothetical protein
VPPPSPTIEIDAHLPELRKLGEVRAHGTEAEQTEFIREAIVAYIRSFADDKAAFDRGDEDVDLTDSTQSDVKYVFHAERARTLAGFRFSLMDPKYQTNETPTTEMILNRPLKGIAADPEDMYMKHKVIPEAWMDLNGECVRPAAHDRAEEDRPAQGRGRCAVQVKEPQFHPKAIKRLIDECFAYRRPGCDGKPRPVYPTPTPEQHELLKDFVEPWKNKIRVGELKDLRRDIMADLSRHGARDVPGFPDAVKAAFPDIAKKNQALERYRRFFSMYFVVEDDEVSRRYEEPEADADQEEAWSLPREAPYDNGRDWTDVGVTSDIIVEVCKRLDRPCKIVFNRTCILGLPAAGLERQAQSACGRSTRCSCGTSRATTRSSTTLNDAGCQLKVKRPPTLPEVKLRLNPLDLDDNRCEHAAMTKWSPEAFMDAWTKKKPMVFWCYDLDEEVRRFLDEKRIGFHPS